MDLVPQLSNQASGTLIDVGAGNGRNLSLLERTLVIALDISDGLLRNYVANPDHQRTLGSVTNLPFRKNSGEEVISIAVVHHLNSEVLRQTALNEIYRINSRTSILTVWRKWRKDLRKQLLTKIRNKEDLSSLIDHERPWKNQTGEIMAYRFYHYYTWKELFVQINNCGFSVSKRVIMGGKKADANFLIFLNK